MGTETEQSGGEDPTVSAMRTLKTLRAVLTWGFVIIGLILLLLRVMRWARFIWIFVAIFAVMIAIGVVIALGSRGVGVPSRRDDAS